MKTTTVKIKGKKYKMKPTFRAMFMFEEMSGKAIHEIDNTKDSVMFMYCILKANNKDVFNYEYEEFVDLLDDTPQILSAFNDFGEGGK